jgi:glycosyltransferase involved in cell wall biosynthesis
MYSVGTVVPAYRPDEDRLVAYVESLVATLDPAVVRIELDDPGGRVDLDGLPARVTVNAVPRRRGKGAAVTAGFEALSTDVYAFADADGSTPVDSLAGVIRPVAGGEAALAVGSRRHPDAEVLGHQTFARRFLGDGFAWLARRLLDPALYDYQCGAKALTAETWAAVREGLHEAGFAWDIELIALAGALDGRAGVGVARAPPRAGPLAPPRPAAPGRRAPDARRRPARRPWPTGARRAAGRRGR